MIREMIRDLVEGREGSVKCGVPLFVLPDNPTGLIICMSLFLIVAFLIYSLERIWMRRFVFKTIEAQKLQRILIWEFGTVVSILTVFILKQYCVVLPLLFLLAFLIMWYLVRVIVR